MIQDPRLKRKISDSSKPSFLSKVCNKLPKATLNISVNLLQQEDIPPSLEHIAADVTENCTNNRIDCFNSKLSFSDSQIHKLELP